MPKIITFLIDVVAVYRLSKLILDDEITADLRDKVFDHFPPNLTKTGYMITCPWCISIWAGGALFGLRKINPDAANYVSYTLAASAATGLAYEKGL